MNDTAMWAATISDEKKRGRRRDNDDGQTASGE